MVSDSATKTGGTGPKPHSTASPSSRQFRAAKLRPFLVPKMVPPNRVFWLPHVCENSPRPVPDLIPPPSPASHVEARTHVMLHVTINGAFPVSAHLSACTCEHGMDMHIDIDMYVVHDVMCNYTFMGSSMSTCAPACPCKCTLEPPRGSASPLHTGFHTHAEDQKADTDVDLCICECTSVPGGKRHI